MSDHERTDLRDRLIRLETIIGDDTRGVLSEIKQLKASVEGLKFFQVKILTIFGVLAVGAQILLQVFLK